MAAEITYNAGKTYRVKGHVFKQGVVQTVSDQAVIERCRSTAGFTVFDLPTPKKAAPSDGGQKVVKKVVKKVEAPAKADKKTQSF